MSNLSVISAVIIILVLAVIAGAVYVQRRKRSERLKRRFGPEYGHTIEQLGDAAKAEADLVAREQRVDRLNIIPLVASEATRFRLSWNMLQGRFVDNPNVVVDQADRLVCELMQKRGYPMGDFERRVEDISVDHPRVVTNYRAAHAIALRHKNGEATTEDLRRAVVHYRALFNDLLEVGDPQADLSSAQARRRFTVPS
ncbi:MAG TPA: hypothetical protein VGI65_16805 [Steroidobacteraceae bacterium]|jgi:hypothetical protein